MFYVYVLRSKKDLGLYIGYSKDLKKRFKQHNKGQSQATKNRTPFVLLYYEAFIHSSDARAREMYLKSGYGRKQLHLMLKKALSLFK